MKKGHRPKYNFETISLLIKQGKNLQELGEIYNVCSSSMGRVLRKANVEYNLLTRKIEKNINFFENISTEIQAYLLGFFVADGCVYNKNRIGICIAEQDEYIVNLFKSSIAPDSLIKRIHNIKGAKNRQIQLFLRISSEKLVSDLKVFGVEERKTFKPITLPSLKNNLKWHFIRGYFDGDGHLGRRVTKSGYDVCRISLSNGDETLLKDIQQFTGVGAIRKQGNCSRLDIENLRDCKTFLNGIYKDANFCLPRKFNKYLEVNAEVFANSKKTANSVTHRS